MAFTLGAIAGTGSPSSATAETLRQWHIEDKALYGGGGLRGGDSHLVKRSIIFCIFSIDLRLFLLLYYECWNCSSQTLRDGLL